MTVVRLEPWALVNRLQKGYRSLIRRAGDHCNRFGRVAAPCRHPREAQQFVLHVDLPGVDPQAVEITSDHGVLTIRVSAKRPARGTPKDIVASSGYRRFLRRFSLPDSVTPSNNQRRRRHVC